MWKSMKGWGFVLGLLLLLQTTPVHAEGGAQLYTPYIHMNVPPGEKLTYSLELMNKSEAVKSTEISVTGLPRDWEHQLTAGGRTVSALSVKPKDSATVQLEVKVPLKVDKGSYSFQVQTSSFGKLPLTVDVSETGTYRTELSFDKSNMEGHAGTSFTYKASLYNATAEEQTYSLQAAAPAGWDVQFSEGSNRISSIQVAAGQTTSINIAVKPPEQAAADTYKLDISAAAGSTNVKETIETVITGSYGIELTTPNGLLSAEMNAGRTKSLDLVVKNTGTSPLENIEFNKTIPAHWQIEFQPESIERIEAGGEVQVSAKLQSDSSAIAGDYVASISAKTAQVSDSTDMRITVKTSVLWGWLGILIIAGVAGGIFVLFRKYGRR